MTEKHLCRGTAGQGARKVGAARSLNKAVAHITAKNNI